MRRCKDLTAEIKDLLEQCGTDAIRNFSEKEIEALLSKCKDCEAFGDLSFLGCWGFVPHWEAIIGAIGLVAH